MEGFSSNPHLTNPIMINYVWTSLYQRVSRHICQNLWQMPWISHWRWVSMTKIGWVPELRLSKTMMNTLNWRKWLSPNLCHGSYRKDDRRPCQFSSYRLLEEHSLISIDRSDYLKMHTQILLLLLIIGLSKLVTVPQRNELIYATFLHV